MPKIFICYRREDSAWPAQVIHEKLEGHFGSDSVIIDIDNIPMGTDFSEYLNRQVSKCDIFLAVIGDHWMKTLEQRLADADDFVRIEIQKALERKIPVVPILVGEASVPSKKKLPEEIEKLSYMQATPVRTGPDLQTHLKRLTKGIDRILVERKAEEERKQKEAEEERKRKEAEEAKHIAEKERNRKEAEESKHKAEAERKRKEAEEARRKAEEERKRKEELERIEAARKAEQERKQKEAKEERRRKEEDEKPEGIRMAVAELKVEEKSKKKLKELKKPCPYCRWHERAGKNKCDECGRVFYEKEELEKAERIRAAEDEVKAEEERKKKLKELKKPCPYCKWHERAGKDKCDECGRVFYEKEEESLRARKTDKPPKDQSAGNEIVIGIGILLAIFIWIIAMAL